MARAVLAICAAALVCAGASASARATSRAVQDVTIVGDGGVQLACGFLLPTGAAPTGGWPGVIFFPGEYAVSHSSFPATQEQFAERGFASVSCDERGRYQSGGSFDLAGSEDAADAQHIFDWLAAQPGVSHAEIGASGYDLGGAEVWDAAVHGVPFKAMVVGNGWTSLAQLLHGTGVMDAAIHDNLTALGPTTWDTPSGIASRSYTAKIGSLRIPTLVTYPRANLLGDLTQAAVQYRPLHGPKRLAIRWEQSEDSSDPEILRWFDKYLADGPPVGHGVEIEHASPSTATTTFTRFPRTRSVSVNLPGSSLKRSVWLPGGPLETLGRGSLTIHYSHASWTQVVAEVYTAGGKTFVTDGAEPLRRQASVVTIPLLNYMSFLPRGRKLTVVLSSHSFRYGGTSGGKISIGRVTLKLSVLQRAVSH